MTPRTRVFTATEMGWVRHSAMGVEVWEMPDGQLYVHSGPGEPVITIIDYEIVDYRKGPYGV